MIHTYPIDKLLAQIEKVQIKDADIDRYCIAFSDAGNVFVTERQAVVLSGVNDEKTNMINKGRLFFMAIQEFYFKNKDPSRKDLKGVVLSATDEQFDEFSKKSNV